ncbi:hypothetical protein [Brachybacterium sp. GPGPB12]|uniref:hypothetical protein n=1 Tax=Brachybacterium sp. GPGPB12 TaxID=3023517 RepID=UPI003134431E
MTGGGAASAPWSRILADVTGRPVRTVDGTDAALLGRRPRRRGGARPGPRPGHARRPTGGGDDRPRPVGRAAASRARPAHRALYDAAARVRRLR